MDMKPKNLLQRVLSFARAELERRGRGAELDEPPRGRERERAESASEQLDRPTRNGAPASPAAPALPHGQRLEALRSHGGDGLVLRWSVSERDVARAQRLVPGKPVLCLRLVSFTRARDDVLREVQDRPGLELAGQCELTEAPQRAVVALGLRAGERFVSIAHHVL